MLWTAGRLLDELFASLAYSGPFEGSYEQLCFPRRREELARYQGSCREAESSVQTDPKTPASTTSRSIELIVNWIYKADSTLRLPYQDNLGALIHEPTFKQAVGEVVLNKARLMTEFGNRAVHDNRPIPEPASAAVVRELFHVCYWLAHTYTRGKKPPPGLAYNQRRCRTVNTSRITARGEAPGVGSVAGSAG